MWKEEKYDALKFEYFGLIDGSRANLKVNKGDMRAFVGLKAWSHERDRLDAGEDKYTAHLSAFEDSLGELRRVLKSRRFYEEFKKDLVKWPNRGGLLNRNGGGKVLLPPPIPKMSSWKGNGYTLISLFSGALGLDLGFLAAGYELRLANDIDENSYNTVKTNIPSIPFILDDFNKVSTENVLREAGLGIGEVDVLTGGPPCQPFSTAGKRRGLNDPRASPLKEFVRAIKEIKPRAFVMEEVTGLKSSRLKHVPISERGSRILKPEERKGSAFKVVLDMLRTTGYKLKYDILNAADFGSPQSRNRLIFIGLREGSPSLPRATHSNIPKIDLNGRALQSWNTFWECTSDLQGNRTEFTKTSPIREEYMKFIPPGGYWRHLPGEIIEKAMGGAHKSEGGKMGYFRRLSWNEPSPTVVTSPAQKSTMLFHPEDFRPISIEEYKRIQGFPDDWKIIGSTVTKYRLIGDAVPVHLSYAIAKEVLSLLG